MSTPFASGPPMCDETDSIVNQSDMECYHSLSASHSTRHRTASEILHDQLSALNQSHAAHNVQSSFLYGCKPPWGWDYMLCFKMPKLLYSQLFDTHTDTHTEAQSTVLSIPHVDQYDPDAADDLPLHVDSKSNDRNQQRVQILARLKSAGFSFSQLLVPSERAILVRISLCEALLKEKAVLIGMQLKLQKKYGSGYLPFSHDKAHVFENYQVAQHRSSYFSPAERALIILRVLQSKESWGCHLNLERLLYEKHLIKAFALHSTHEHKSLIHRCVWQNCWDPTWQPPFDDMKNYLGARVTFYFVFASFYARRLLVIALLSIPVFVIYRVIRNAKVLTILRCIFSTGLVIWATFFLETWKRRNANVNIQWGVHDYHEETAEETRAQFEGELRNGFYCEGGFVSLDDMTDMTSAQESAQILLRPGRESIILPQNKYENPAFARNAQLVSIAVTVLFVVLVGCLTFLLLRFRNEVVTQGAKLTGLQFANAIPGILNGVLITVFDAIWRAVSMSLTRRENHRTTQRFENSLIYKRFAFQFVSNYVSLLYIAFVGRFVKGSCGIELSEKEDCMAELEKQLMALVITKATIGQITEVGIPYIRNGIRQWRSRRKSDITTDGKGKLKMNENWEHKVTCAHNKYVEQYHLGQYNCTMEDYGELVIQFGYLVLFSVAFPPASVVILLNNIVEVRSDSFKILALSQRVNADDAASIGAWYAILEFLNILAVATNVGLLIFTTDSLDVLFGLERRLGEDEGRKMLVRVVVFFSLEHALLGMKALLAAVVNDVPKAAYRNMARQTFEIARWFDQGWRDAFRGGSLLQVDERQVQLCANYAHVFDVASDED